MSNPSPPMAASFGSHSDHHPPPPSPPAPLAVHSIVIPKAANDQIVQLQIPLAIGMETIPPYEHEEEKDPNLHEDDGVNNPYNGKQYAQTLPLLSRLKPQNAVNLVDFTGVREDISGDGEKTHFSLSVSGVGEATNLHPKFSPQGILPAQDRSKPLRHAGLALSLGICTKQSFDLSGFGSPLSVRDQASGGSLAFERWGVLKERSKTPPPPAQDSNKTASKRLNTPTEAPTAQLTIFYDGKVHMYNNVPQDKAKAIMFLAESATRASPQLMENRLATQISSTNASTFTLNCSTSADHADTLPQTSQGPSVSVGNALSGLQSAGNISYTALPQHRKISLQRFLQKRTERARAASPYVANKNADMASDHAPGSRPSSPALNASARSSSPAALQLAGGSPCRSSASEVLNLNTHKTRSVDRDLRLQ